MPVPLWIQTDGEVPEGSQLPQLDEDNENHQEEEDKVDQEGEAVYGQEDEVEDGEGEEEDDDFDDSNPPLLFVDVNLGANEQQRIIVYEGDTAPELAIKFCQEHDLDDET